MKRLVLIIIALLGVAPTAGAQLSDAQIVARGGRASLLRGQTREPVHECRHASNHVMASTLMGGLGGWALGSAAAQVFASTPKQRVELRLRTTIVGGVVGMGFGIHRLLTDGCEHPRRL